jgi:hypothetical protein
MGNKGKIMHSSPKEKKEDVNVLHFFKRMNLKYSYLILLAFLVLGFYLRYYHIEYPVIGYHNWKDAHYITEARNFEREGFFKYGFFVPMRDTTENMREPPDGQHNDTFPFISIIVGILFKFFGESLVLARLVGILFSLATVVVAYLLIRELFEREDLALVSAFLTAINPMYVFFSHNIMTVTPALFFMLLGAYLYVRWLKRQFEKNKFSTLYLASFFIMLGAIMEYDFILIIFPILATFPYKKVFINIKNFLKPLFISGFISLGFPGWFYYSEIYVKKYIFGKALTGNALDSYEITKLIDFSIIWDSQFWQILKSYVADNFSLIGMSFAFLGLFLFLVMFFTKNNKKTSHRFMIGYLAGSVIWFFVMGFKLSGHNYHQYPIGPFIIFMIAYFIIVISDNIASAISKKGNIKTIIEVIVISLIIFMPPVSGLYAKSMESKDRMFNTQFPGLDIAGEYMKAHKAANDRMLHSSGQSYGVLWHADMKGYKGPGNLAYVEDAENNYNVTWIFVYQWGIQSYFQNQEIFDHIKNKYRLVEFAFMQINQQQIQPLYFLFRKGGTFNESEINNMLQKGLQEGKLSTRTYFYTTGPYQVNYMDFE